MTALQHITTLLRIFIPEFPLDKKYEEILKFLIFVRDDSWDVILNVHRAPHGEYNKYNINIHISIKRLMKFNGFVPSIYDNVFLNAISLSAHAHSGKMFFIKNPVTKVLLYELLLKKVHYILPIVLKIMDYVFDSHLTRLYKKMFKRMPRSPFKRFCLMKLVTSFDTKLTHNLDEFICELTNKCPDYNFDKDITLLRKYMKPRGFITNPSLYIITFGKKESVPYVKRKENDELVKFLKKLRSTFLSHFPDIDKYYHDTPFWN